MSTIKLRGKVIITGQIRTKTGLHIGGAAAGLDIGGIDNPIVRHPVTREPYIPGSSLRGKLRSLLERLHEKVLNKAIRNNPPMVRIHECGQAADYAACPICQIFGVTPDAGSSEWARPTRLLVRDVALSKQKVKVEVKAADGTITESEMLVNQKLLDAKLDLPFTEVKWEAVIDRITAAAVPRQNERVPADAVFGDFELVYGLYDVDGAGATQDAEWLQNVFTAMLLLEDDYLGGYGSRGTGKIAFENLTVTVKSAASYEGGAEPKVFETKATLAELNWDEILPGIKEALAVTVSPTELETELVEANGEQAEVQTPASTESTETPIPTTPTE